MNRTDNQHIVASVVTRLNENGCSALIVVVRLIGKINISERASGMRKIKSVIHRRVKIEIKNSGRA